MTSFKANTDRIPEYNFALSQIEIERPMEGKTHSNGKDWLYVYYPITIVHIPSFREPEYLIFSIILPLMLLNFFTLTVFFMESTDFSGKLGIIVTILLALFAFTFSIRSSLPQVPYITLLEYHVILALVVLFIQGIAAVVEYLTEDNVSLMTKYIAGGLDLVIVVVFYIIFIRQWILYKTECNVYDKENEDYKKQQAKIQSAQTEFKFMDCIGRGLKYSKKKI